MDWHWSAIAEWDARWRYEHPRRMSIGSYCWHVWANFGFRLLPALFWRVRASLPDRLGNTFQRRRNLEREGTLFCGFVSISSSLPLFVLCLFNSSIVPTSPFTIQARLYRAPIMHNLSVGKGTPHPLHYSAPCCPDTPVCIGVWHRDGWKTLTLQATVL
jgi:hypothetical protein